VFFVDAGYLDKLRAGRFPQLRRDLEQVSAD
jgi:hypothetical protein